MYVYIKSEPELWTVGFYDPDGEWVPYSDHGSESEAAERVAYLNGGNKPSQKIETVGDIPLRDYFAAAAMPTLIGVGGYFDDQLARRAYVIADAMLAERSKGGE